MLSAANRFQFIAKAKKVGKTLLHMDGAENSAAFVDVHGKAVAVTGTARQQAASAKFGGAGLRIDADSSLITVSGEVVTPGTGDFGFSLWYKPTVLNNNRNLMGSRADVTSTVNGFHMRYSSGGDLNFFITANAISAGAGSLVVGTWTHVEFNRKDGVGRMFINGVTVAADVAMTNNFNIGTISLGSSPGYSFGAGGHIDEFYMQTGSVINWANFTPPVAPYPDTP